MVITTKFFKDFARNVAQVAVLLAALISHINEAAADARGLGEIDLQVSSERVESAGSASVERHFRLGVYGGLVSTLDSGDRLSFGGFLKTDRGQQALGALNSYGLGLFVGWARESLSLRFGYTLFGETKSMSAAVETAWREASGYELLARWITWNKELEGNRELALGPSLSYEKVTYKKSQVGSLPETNQELTREALVPGISFLFVY